MTTKIRRLFWLLVLCLVAARATPANAAQQPNVILIFIDDMGWGDLSCFGGKAAETENLDRLAAEGVRFEQFYVNSPICSPSRCAITTGQYPQRWGISSYLNNRKDNARRGVADWLDPSAPSLARELQKSGYATGHFGKWHLGGQRDVGDAPLITEYGFDCSLTNFEGLGSRLLALCDAYDGKQPRRWDMNSRNLGRGEITWMDRSVVTAGFTKAAAEFIREAADRDQPFYVNVWPDDVHRPLFPPEGRRGGGTTPDLYAGVLDAMDEQLAELIDLIRGDERLCDNTLILACSDNGHAPSVGNGGPFRGCKATLYEGGIRSPLIAWGTGVLTQGAAGKVNSESVFAAFDLAPTLLAIAGVAPGAMADADGEALPEVLLGESTESRSQPIFFRRPPDRDTFKGYKQLPDLAVREGRWKLLCEYDGLRPQLYDVLADPGESRNQAADELETAQRLTQAVRAWNDSMPADKGPQLAAKRKP